MDVEISESIKRDMRFVPDEDSQKKMLLFVLAVLATPDEEQDADTTLDDRLKVQGMHTGPKRNIIEKAI